MIDRYFIQKGVYQSLIKLCHTMKKKNEEKIKEPGK